MTGRRMLTEGGKEERVREKGMEEGGCSAEGTFFPLLHALISLVMALHIIFFSYVGRTSM